MAFRFDNLSELQSTRRLHGLRGVAFPRLEQTFARLEAEHKAELRERRRELAQQRRAIDESISRLKGKIPWL